MVSHMMIQCVRVKVGTGNVSHPLILFPADLEIMIGVATGSIPRRQNKSLTPQSNHEHVILLYRLGLACCSGHQVHYCAGVKWMDAIL